MTQRGPVALASRPSEVTSGADSSSARATYAASQGGRLVRSCQVRDATTGNSTRRRGVRRRYAIARSARAGEVSSGRCAGTPGETDRRLGHARARLCWPVEGLTIPADYRAQAAVALDRRCRGQKSPSTRVSAWSISCCCSALTRPT